MCVQQEAMRMNAAHCHRSQSVTQHTSDAGTARQ